MAILGDKKNALNSTSTATQVAQSALASVSVGVFQTSSIEQNVELNGIKISNITGGSVAEINVTASIDSSQAVRLLSSSDQKLQSEVLNQVSSVMDIMTEGNGFKAGAGLGGVAASAGPLFGSSDVRNIVNNSMNLANVMSSALRSETSNSNFIKQNFVNNELTEISDVSGGSTARINIGASIKTIQDNVVNNQNVQRAIAKLDQALALDTKTSIPQDSMFWIMIALVFVVGGGFVGKQATGSKKMKVERDEKGDPVIVNGKPKMVEDKSWSAMDYVKAFFVFLVVLLLLFLVYKVVTCFSNLGECFIDMFKSFFGGVGSGLSDSFGL